MGPSIPLSGSGVTGLLLPSNSAPAAPGPSLSGDRAGSYNQALSGNTGTLSRLLRRVRLRRKSQRKSRRSATKAAAAPVAMPAMDALWCWLLPVPVLEMGRVDEPFVAGSMEAEVGGAAVVVAENAEEVREWELWRVVEDGEDVGVGDVDAEDDVGSSCELVCEVEDSVVDGTAADVEVGIDVVAADAVVDADTNVVVVSTAVVVPLSALVVGEC